MLQAIYILISSWGQPKCNCFLQAEIRQSTFSHKHWGNQFSFNKFSKFYVEKKQQGEISEPIYYTYHTQKQWGM